MIRLIFLYGLLSIATVTGSETADSQDMDYAETVVIDQHNVREQFLPMFSKRRYCFNLGAAVVNKNDCCSLSAGPREATLIKKCCLPEGQY